MLDALHPVGDRLEHVKNCFGGGIDPTALWLDLLRPTREEELLAEAFIGAGLPTREEMEEIEPSSRLSVEDGALYLTAALLCRSESTEPGTTAVSFVLHGDRLATIRYDEPGTMPLALQRITKPGSGVTTGRGALMTVVEAAIDRLADVIERVGARLAEIAREVFDATAPRRQMGGRYSVALRNIGREGLRLGHIEESLTSLSRLMFYLIEKADSFNFQADDKLRMTTMMRDIEALAIHTRGFEDRVTFLLDATLGMISIEQNGIIKIFSVLAVIFMPPTLVASIYGMNFDHMPELHWAIGYPMALLIMLGSVLLTFAVFRWRRWL